jgi:FkbM family methyltransferase
MLSYAQNGEDVVLSRAFADQELGFYVDIGACHPVEDSVTLHFYERGWHGVNVEPDRELLAAFLQTRPRDSSLGTAVGRTRGRIAFHPTGTRGHGTLDATLAGDRSAGRPVERVPIMLLSDVIDCYGPDDSDIDFLKIDVEGWEAEVLASGDWARHRPRILLIEAVDEKGDPTHEAWEPDLLRAGYRFGMFDGLNRFYCRDEDAGLLLPRLGVPANVRDGWMRARDEQAHASAARLQAELAAAALRAAAAEDRSAALGADLDAANENERAARDQLIAVTTEVERLRAETAAVANEPLVVDAERARAEAAAALRREEAAEARMAVLEMDLVRRDSAAQARIAALETDLRRCEADDRALHAWVAAVRTSTSWRVTKPLRAVSLLLRGRR